MLTLHAGMPKTGTTALQARLADNSKWLAAAGIDYPQRWRNAEGIAQHRFGERLVDDADAETVTDELVEYLRTRSGNILISSESMTNLLNRHRLPQLSAMFARVREYTDVRFVIALRALDEFQESMFLHAIKSNDRADIDIGDFLAKRVAWGREFFEGLARVRENLGAENARFIPYSKTPAFLDKLLVALGVDRSLPETVRGPEFRNQALSLKCQIVLAHLDGIKREIDRDLPRRRLVRAMYAGILAFDQDLDGYRVLAFEEAERHHREALGWAKEFGIDEYVDAFADRAIEPYECRELAFSAIGGTDFSVLRRWADRGRPVE